MPLRKNNTRTWHRKLYAGQLQELTLLKRDDDQRQGVVRSLHLYQCRRGQITKTGEQISADEQVDHRTTWKIPKVELERVGVAYINGADRFVDPVEGGTWQPEATTRIEIKLFGNWVDVECLRTDPPR